MSRPWGKRILQRIGQIGENEGTTAILMFSYSFLAMTAYNIIKPITRSKFISDLGADNIPYVQLAAGVLIGLLMAVYTRFISRLPRRWALQIIQAFIAALLVAFWFLFRSGEEWVSVAFYLTGLILGILLISQFWTLANVVYDARQAKRLFGFIGGGAPLGGITGSLITTSLVDLVGTNNLLLVSAAVMLACTAIVSVIIVRERVEGTLVAEEEKGVGTRRALKLLSSSRHLQLIALVISFAAVGAAIIEQQLNMAAQAAKGQQATDALTAFLGQVQLLTSIAGLVIQVWLTSRIHRYLGIGFALMILPVSLGTTATVMLLNAALWAPSLARVLDQSLRYTVDKTTREILYMPLPVAIKYEAKPFVDVTVDRFAKGLGAVLILFLIKPWGLHLGWQQVSYASVLMTGLWLYMAVRARRGYQNAFRQSMDARTMEPAEMRLSQADLATVEALIQELASPDEHRVLYAIDLLESLDKRNLVTPLLLYHESPAVRVRALSIVGNTQPEISVRWLPAVRHMVGDQDPKVRMAAVGALAQIRSEKAVELARTLLDDADPRISMTAAMVLARNGSEEEAEAAGEMLRRLATDSQDAALPARLDLARAVGGISGPGFRRLLIPLLHDPNDRVAAEAMRSARQVAGGDYFFVPTLVSLLGCRRLKGAAREMLVGYGEEVLGILNHFLRDSGEDIWVRRHLPATIAHIPCQQAMDILVGALEEEDVFLRHKAGEGLERLRRLRPELTLRREPVEALTLDEAGRYLQYRPVYRRLFESDGLPSSCLLGRALVEKLERIRDRLYHLLGILYPWQDIAAARWAIERGDGRSRAAALEYLDNLLKGSLRKQVVPVLEEKRPVPGTRTASARPVSADAQESLIQAIYDHDEVIAASAISLMAQMKLENLAGHVEQVLATRNVRDLCVFEAASWVLASFRLSEAERRSRWREPLPSVELADQLSLLPLFSAVWVDELFRIAAAGNQVRHEPGDMLYEERAMPQSLRVLLQGSVACSAADGPERSASAPAALGFREVLQGLPMEYTVRMTEPGVCLTASSEDFQTLLSDNPELLQGLFHMLDTAGPAERIPPVMQGHTADTPPGPEAATLSPIDKILLLQNLPLFARIEAEEMRWMASISEEVTLSTGSVLYREGDPPAIWVLVSGELSLASSQSLPPAVAHPSDAVGVHETLAGRPLSSEARVSSEGRALRIDRYELFDLLGQRPGLLQQLFRSRL